MMNRKLVSYVIILFIFLLVSTMTVSASAKAAGFDDVASKHWAAEAIDWAIQNEIVQGYTDGTFRPEQKVTEAEFLVMLLRAYPNVLTPAVASDAPWYASAYELAMDYRWPVIHELTAANQFDRGRVALLIAASQGRTGIENEAIQYLLDQGLARGKTSATVGGYDAPGKLSRAEAVTFIRNLKDQGAVLREAPKSKAAFSVKGLAVGQTEPEVIAMLGEPARKDPSIYGFTWYVYKASYQDYAQVGMKDGKVVALYSLSSNWDTSSGVTKGSAFSAVTKAYGTPLAYVLKGNTRYLLNTNDQEELVYSLDGAYATFFIDKHVQNQATALLVVEKSIEEKTTRDRIVWNDSLKRAFERQSFDLANAARAQFKLPAFSWSEAISGTARKHSQDMVENSYFDHTSPTGVTLGDRVQRDQIGYRSVAENIAAGQLNALYAHAGWMNSEGHRRNLLGQQSKLGVGVVFGGDYGTYYTQNFLTP